jgi:regulatory protein YycI of two-component signal transduction system YycFG
MQQCVHDFLRDADLVDGPEYGFGNGDHSGRRIRLGFAQQFQNFITQALALKESVISARGDGEAGGDEDFCVIAHFSQICAFAADDIDLGFVHG